MLIARVLLGDVYVCETARHFRRPPCKGVGCNLDDCSTHELFDSVMGVGKSSGKRLLFREFIVYDRQQCYPDYIIKYKRIWYTWPSVRRRFLLEAVSIMPLFRTLYRSMMSFAVELWTLYTLVHIAIQILFNQLFSTVFLLGWTLRSDEMSLIALLISI